MKFSLLDLSLMLPGQSRREALLTSIEIAKYVESLNFYRIWLGEHHTAHYICGRAPEILIASIAENTSTIRVGSGAVLLRHYSPYKIAEVFCTLNELYPGRVDLGIGRASTGPVTDFALQQTRSNKIKIDTTQQIHELCLWLDNSFEDDHPFSKFPIHTTENIPELHVLGTNSWSASTAAELGLRYVYAGFLNQNSTNEVIQTYREKFMPCYSRSGVEKAEVILATHIVCADTEKEARAMLAPVTVLDQRLSIGNLESPILSQTDALKILGDLPKLTPYKSGSCIPPKFIAGTQSQVFDQLSQLAYDLSLDEIIVKDFITDHNYRKRSYELLSDFLN